MAQERIKPNYILSDFTLKRHQLDWKALYFCLSWLIFNLFHSDALIFISSILTLFTRMPKSRNSRVEMCTGGTSPFQFDCYYLKILP